MQDKEKITAFFKELFPDVTVHVLFSGERWKALGSVYDELEAAHGPQIIPFLEMKEVTGATRTGALATVARIPLAAEAVYILRYDPHRIDHRVPYDEIYTLAHEAAHPGLARLIDVDGAIREQFPHYQRLRTLGGDIARLEEQQNAVGNQIMRYAMANRMAPQHLVDRQDELQEQRAALEEIVEQWKQFSLPFFQAHALKFFKSRGVTIATADIPAFEEAVCDLFAGVEAARRTEGYTPKKIFEDRADRALFFALGNFPLSTKSAADRQFVVEHFPMGVLDAAAKEPDYFKDPHTGEYLKGDKLLEACIAFAGKHFTPHAELENQLKQAEEKGLAHPDYSSNVPGWIRRTLLNIPVTAAKIMYSDYGNAKILFTTPPTGPVHKLAARLALANMRECERRDKEFRFMPAARSVNNLLRRYYSSLLRLGHGRQ